MLDWQTWVTAAIVLAAMFSLWRRWRPRRGAAMAHAGPGCGTPEAHGATQDAHGCGTGCGSCGQTATPARDHRTQARVQWHAKRPS